MEKAQRRRRVRVALRYAQQRRQPGGGAPVAQRCGGLANLELRQGKHGTGSRHRRRVKQPYGELVGGLRRGLEGRVATFRDQTGELLLVQGA